MPVDIHVCDVCGGIYFIQLRMLHVKTEGCCKTTLVQQEDTPMFQCVQCNTQVLFDED